MIIIKKTIQQIKQKYKILQQLGRGSSGICYRLTKIQTNKDYVLKEIPIFLYDLTKLEQQISISTKIDCPYIIKLHETYQGPQYIYMVYQYNNQIDLQKIIKINQNKNIQYDDKIIWRIFYQLLAGLKYLHSLKIIHRDIKPSNIFINQTTLELKIGDLGSSKLMDSLQNYTRVGTPSYFSPQIIKFEPYNEKTDIWSLGVTLYQLLTSKRLFQQNNIIKLASIICNEDPDYLQIQSSLFYQPLKDMLNKIVTSRLSADELLSKYFTKDIPLFNLNSQDVEISTILKGLQSKLQSSQLIQCNQLLEQTCKGECQFRDTLFKTFTQAHDEVSIIKYQQHSNIKIEHYKEEFIEGISSSQIQQATILLIVKESSSSSNKKAIITLKKQRSEEEEGYKIIDESYRLTKKSLSNKNDQKNHLKFLNKQKSACVVNDAQQQNKYIQSRHIRQQSAIGYNKKHINIMNSLKAKKCQQKQSQKICPIQTFNHPEFILIENRKNLFQMF